MPTRKPRLRKALGASPREEPATARRLNLEDNRTCAPEPRRGVNPIPVPLETAMANVGELFKPGQASPEAGTYMCTGPGCTNTFNASVKGTPLPSSHCTGALWKLSSKTGAASCAPAAPPKPQAATGAPAAKPAAAKPWGSPPSKPGTGTPPKK